MYIRRILPKLVIEVIGDVIIVIGDVMTDVTGVITCYMCYHRHYKRFYYGDCSTWCD